MKALVLSLCALALVLGTAHAQFERRVTVDGVSTAGSSFTLDITSLTDSRSIPMGPLLTDYTASAMAALMVNAINDDFRANGNTGFEAQRYKKADGRTKISETFLITSSSLITDISIGPSGGVGTAPRAPGLAFNPTLIDQESDQPTPFLGTQLGHPNADLRLNGLDPALNHFREIEVMLDPLVGGTLNLQVSGLPNVPIMLIGGPYGDGFSASPNGVFALFAGTTFQQTLDIGTPNPAGGLPLNLFTVADAIFNTGDPGLNPFFFTDATGTFNITHVVPPTVNGFSADGFQAILPDPAMPAPGLRFTQAAHPIYRFGRETEVLLSSDGLAQVNFLPGMSFDFYGALGQTQINVFENGLLTFGGSPPPLGGAQVDIASQLQGDPAIFANWANWQFPQFMGTPVEGVRIYEFGDEIRFAWGFGQGAFGHANDSDVARFECVLRLTDMLNPRPDAGAIHFDFPQLDPNATSQNDSVVGISPGAGGSLAGNFDLGLNRIAPTPAAPLLEQSLRGGTSASVIALASGLAPFYSNGTGWNQRSIDFFAPTGTGPFFDRYVSIPNEARPDDAIGLRPGADQISLSAGGAQVLELIGYFLYAYTRNGAPLIQVTLDPAGSVLSQSQTLLPGPVGQSLNDDRLGAAVVTFPPSAGFRSYEQMRFQAPDLSAFIPAGTTLPVVLDIEVSFPGQAPILIPGAVTIAP
jgi:hypothetical protein